MSNSTLLYRINKEVDSTYLQGDRILVERAKNAGYSSLYNLKDKDGLLCTLLFLYLFVLKTYKSWDSTVFPINIQCIKNLLSKIQSIHQTINCMPCNEMSENDGILNGGVFGGNCSINPSLTDNVLLITTIDGTQIISNSYDNHYFSGYNLVVYYNGVKYLDEGIDYTVNNTGGFTLIGDYANQTFTSTDKFIIIPNGKI